MDLLIGLADLRLFTCRSLRRLSYQPGKLENACCICRNARIIFGIIVEMFFEDSVVSEFHENRHNKIYFRYILIFVLGLLTFGNSINGSFAFDDAEAIINNKDVTSSTSISELFLHDFWGSNISSALSHKSYRPLVVLSFKFNYWICNGLDATSYHAVNILLYGIVCVLFLKFFMILFNKMNNGSHRTGWLSFMTSLLFTLHPLHAENVSAIVGRADLMCSMFFLLAFFSYVKFINTNVSINWKTTYLCIFVFCSICSLLSKEQGITIFGICFMYDLVLENRINRCQSIENLKKVASSRGLLLRVSMLIVLCITFLAFRMFVMGSEIPNFQKFDNPHSFVENPLLRVLNYNYLYFLNAWILINPWWLCFDWSMGCVPIIDSISDRRLLLVIFLDCLVIAILFFYIKKKDSKDKNLIMISGSIVVIPFLPSSNCFFKVGFVIAERNLFMSSAGVCMLVVAGMDRFRSHFKKLVSILFLLLLLIYFIRSVQRSSHWLDEEILFSTGTQVCPRNAKVHYNVAKIAADKGLLSAAFKRYHVAIKLAPSYDQALNNLGNLYKEQGNFTLAEVYLKKALSARPNFAAAWMNLGIAQASLKKFKTAEISYRTAIMHRAKYPDCYYNLGNLFLEQGDHASALLAWRNATLQNARHVSAWTNMMILLDNLGMFQDIDTIAKVALEHNPIESSLYFNYANALGKMGRYEESEKNFLLAIKYGEHTANYHSNLGVLYHRWYKLDKAEHHYEIAMKLDPSNGQLIKNYKLLQSIHHN